MAQNLIANGKNRKKNEEPSTRRNTIISLVPSACTTLKFEELQAAENYESKAIVGRIHRMYDVSKRSGGFLRKVLITDALCSEGDSQPKLSLFLFNRHAEASLTANLQDFIAVMNFTVEKLTCSSQMENILPIQVLTLKEDAEVLLLKDKSVDISGENTETRSPCVSPTKIYEYVKLNAIVSADQSYNIYGVVDRCNRRDMQATGTKVLELALSDETKRGFLCSVFASKDEDFPNISMGDVIRLHRMQVSKYRNILKGKCLKQQFMLVFDRNDPDRKAHTVAKTFTFTAKDNDEVEELFKWATTKNEAKLIGDLTVGDFVSLLCQVVGVYVSQRSDVTVLKLWDGTRTDLFDDNSRRELSMTKLGENLYNIARMYCVNLAVYGPYAAVAADLEPGQFISIFDAHVYMSHKEPYEPQLCIHEQEKCNRGIKVLDISDAKVLQLQERLTKIAEDFQEFGMHSESVTLETGTHILNNDISDIPSQNLGIMPRQVDVSYILSRPGTSRDTHDIINSQPNADILCRPGSSNGAQEVINSQPKPIVSVLNAGIHPGQSTKEFGVETSNQLNMTFSNLTQDEWWKSISTVTETCGHSNVKPSSIESLSNHSVPYKFRLLAYVADFKPKTSSVHKLIHLYCPSCHHLFDVAEHSLELYEVKDNIPYFYCASCKINEKEIRRRPVLEYVFWIIFALCDGTTSSGITATLWGGNAVQFFKGIIPEETLRTKSVADSVFEMIWKICPNSRPVDLAEQRSLDYPTLDVCILSFAIKKRVCYQIFDTRMK